MEIHRASTFLANLLRFENRQIKTSRVEMFRSTLEDLLKDHYQHHWFPDQPCKGSGYRCLRINHIMDPLIAKAGDVCGFDENELRLLLPNELTMWIDPQEVSYRIGENGSICVLYDGTKPPPVNQEVYHRPVYVPPVTVAPTPAQLATHFFVPVAAVSPADRYPGCKESVRHNHWDAFNAHPRTPGMIEHYTAAYVSS